MVFVFGSNEKGIHGGGAAAYAVRAHGAIYGQGVGIQGNSYAIPTCTKPVHIVADTLPLAKVRMYVTDFIKYAKDHPADEFQVTQVGCGLAGHVKEDIAPLFEDAPPNCQFDIAWKELLPNRKYWGTF